MGPIRTTFNISYIPEISQEPNYAAVNRIKSMLNESGYNGEKVELAGITHNYCYLDSYSLKITPNNLIEADVSYSTFWELCGDLRKKSNRIDYIYQGDVCHSWGSQILNSGDYLSNPVYGFDYNFRVNWFPVYTIGSKFPTEVKLLSAEESISFVMDTYRSISFTGENVYNSLLYGNNGNMELKNMSILCQENCENAGKDGNSLIINIDGFKIKSINPAVRVEEFLRVNYQASKYY
jgi:hypothetical protein